MEGYIQILLPLYTFSTDLQSDKAHIGLVIPALLLLIYETLDRMDLKDENQNQFRNDLVGLTYFTLPFIILSRIK